MRGLPRGRPRAAGEEEEESGHSRNPKSGLRVVGRGHTFLQWEDTPSRSGRTLLPAVGGHSFPSSLVRTRNVPPYQECPPLAGMSPPGRYVP
jgi:hypothetical protein